MKNQVGKVNGIINDCSKKKPQIKKVDIKGNNPRNK